MHQVRVSPSLWCDHGQGWTVTWRKLGLQFMLENQWKWWTKPARRNCVVYGTDLIHSSHRGILNYYKKSLIGEGDAWRDVQRLCFESFISPMLWRFSCCESQEKDSGPRNICQQFFVILSREIWVDNMQLSFEQFQHPQWFGLRIPHGHV